MIALVCYLPLGISLVHANVKTSRRSSCAALHLNECEERIIALEKKMNTCVRAEQSCDYARDSKEFLHHTG